MALNSVEKMKLGSCTASEFFQNWRLGLLVLKHSIMKQLLFSMVLLTAISVQAQKTLFTAKVPAATKEAFAKAHPNVTGKWEKEEGAYEVTFKEAGKDKSCVIDKAGSIKETETVIPFSELPPPVTAYINKHYKGVRVKEAAVIVKADGTTLYEAEIKGKDVLFDANGNLTKTKKDHD